jgi:hypothetical protein
VQKGRLQPRRSQAFKRLTTTILAAFLGLYLLFLSVFEPYFNWTHARDHGLLQWVLFGEVVASAKAVLWPYNDVDVFLLMEDTFDVSQLTREARLLFDHAVAQTRFGGSVFWLRRLREKGA